MTDEAAIRSIVEEESTAWTQGDAAAFSRHFAENGTCTNILGQLFIGHDAFLKQHDLLFKGPYRGTTLHHDVVSLQFVRPDVAIVEVLTSVTGFQKLAPGLNTDKSGRLRTRLLQVLEKDKDDWMIVAYHNVDVKSQAPVPDPEEASIHHEADGAGAH
ncbi:MAG TPA: SgcJ/EcaC family oxidoreductase [Candidatus Acidoferrum sp.]